MRWSEVVYKKFEVENGATNEEGWVEAIDEEGRGGGMVLLALKA